MNPGGAYKKGYRNEKKSREYLEEQGFLVIESRGSHGLWDLIGVHVSNRHVVLVQVKSNRKPSTKEMAAMQDFPRPLVGVKLVHVWHDHARAPVVIEV